LETHFIRCKNNLWKMKITTTTGFALTLAAAGQLAGAIELDIADAGMNTISKIAEHRD
jgi:hypothetical protein